MKLSNIEINCQSIYKFTNPYLEDEVKGKRLIFYRLSYLKNGEIDYFFGNTKYSLKKGDAILVPANTVYSTKAYGKPLEKINITFSFVKIEGRDKLIDGMECFFDANDKFRVHFEDFTELNNPKVFRHIVYEHDFCSLENDFYKHGDINRLKINAKVTLLIMNLLEEKTERGSFYKEIEDYINDNVFTDISCKSVAEHFNYHPNYLNRIVSERSGNNLHFMITSAKIKSACKMLLDGKKSVIEIAEELCFYDNSHFTKTFIKMTGISPSEYRKIYS